MSTQQKEFYSRDQHQISDKKKVQQLEVFIINVQDKENTNQVSANQK